jgi:hypothetical protein
MLRLSLKAAWPILRTILRFALVLVSLLGFFIIRRQFQRGYQLFELTEESRNRLLKAYPPKFTDVVAEHITYRFGVARSVQLPALPNRIEVIGYICDDSLECVVVAVDGSYERPDGRVFHITLSKQSHRKARESNDVIASYGWIESDEELVLEALPRFRPR